MSSDWPNQLRLEYLKIYLSLFLTSDAIHSGYKCISGGSLWIDRIFRNWRFGSRKALPIFNDCYFHQLFLGPLGFICIVVNYSRIRITDSFQISTKSWTAEGNCHFREYAGMYHNVNRQIFIKSTFKITYYLYSMHGWYDFIFFILLQGFVLDSLGNYNIIECIPPKISSMALVSTIKSILTLFESFVLGSFAFRLYVLDNTHLWYLW